MEEKVKVYRSKKAQSQIQQSYDTLLAQWGCSKTERDVSTTYGSTHIIECGNASLPPLVLFHGVGDDSALMWIFNAAFLSGYFHVFAVDTLGGPGKSVPNENYNKNFDDALWIDQVLDALEIDKAFFAGVSCGGYLVQYFTLNRPDRVLKGISISNCVPAGKRKGIVPPLFKVFLPEALFPSDKNVMKLMKKICGSRYTVFTENDDIMFHWKSLLKGFNNMAMAFHKVRNFSSQEIDAIRGKVFYLAGEEDPFVKLGGREALVAYKMNTIFYEDAGHGLNHELSGEINQKIVDILLHNE